MKNDNRPISYSNIFNYESTDTIYITKLNTKWFHIAVFIFNYNIDAAMKNIA